MIRRLSTYQYILNGKKKVTSIVSSSKKRAKKYFLKHYVHSYKIKQYKLI